MRKITLAACLMLLYGTANATMIYDYDHYETTGILDDVLGKLYIEDERKRTKKVIRTDRKLSKVLVKGETKGWSDNKVNKKVSRKETKIARTITKMDLEPLAALPVEAPVVEVPEPSPLLLIGLGLVGLGVSRKYLKK